MKEEDKINEVALILSQEVNKFRTSNANNKLSEQQFEYYMKRLAQRILNEVLLWKD